MNAGRAIVVTAIGSTQTVAWASSYYMPAILGAPIAKALHLSSDLFFGFFSAALLLSAVIGPSVGRLIDRHGGRLMLAASNLVIAAGLTILAVAHGIAGLAVAWTVLGLGIGMGLYDPAFAALTWLYGREARGAITGITLIAGFASTIGWPASALFLHEWGWRAACLIWAGLNILVAAPVNWLAIPRHGLPAAAPRIAERTARGRTAARGDADPGLLLCRDLVRPGRYGGASAGPAAPGRSVDDRGDRGGDIGRPGPGRRAARRVRAVAFVPPGLLGADRLGAAPGRRRRSWSCSAPPESSRSRCCTAPATA